MRYYKLTIISYVLVILASISFITTGCGGGGNGVGIGTTLWWLDKNDNNNSTSETTIKGPIFVSAIAENNGTKLFLTFDKELKPEGLAAGDFTILMNNKTIEVTLAKLNSDPKVVELALSRTVLFGQPVTVAYTKGSASGTNGKHLDSFLPAAVINNVISGDIADGEYAVTATAPVTDGQIQYVSGTTMSVIIVRTAGENLIYNNGQNFNALKDYMSVTSNGLSAGDKITAANGKVTGLEISGLNIEGTERTFSLKADTLKIGPVKNFKKLIIAGDSTGNIIAENYTANYGDVIITGTKNGDLTLTGVARVIVGHNSIPGNILGTTKLISNNNNYKPELTVSGSGTLSGPVTLSSGTFFMQSGASAVNEPIIIDNDVSITILKSTAVKGLIFKENGRGSLSLDTAVPIDITDASCSIYSSLLSIYFSADIPELLITQKDTAPRAISGKIANVFSPIGYGMISWYFSTGGNNGNEIAYSINSGEKTIKLTSLKNRTGLNVRCHTGMPGVISSADCKVYSLALDRSDNLYIGGSFNQNGTVNLAKWDGSNWSSPGSLDGTCRKLLTDNDGNLYAGGEFTNAGGTSANKIAKWNGSSWSALGSGLNGTCYSIATDGAGNVYAGGSFTQAGGIPANYIAKWDGSNWSALGSGLSSTCYSIAIDSAGNVYAGGSFTQAGGKSANYIAKWDVSSSSWSALSGLYHTCYSIAIDGANIYATDYDKCKKWGGSSWSDLYSYKDNIRIIELNKILVDDGKIYIGGVGRDSYVAEVHSYLKWDGSYWQSGRVFGITYDIAIDKTRRIIYCGGDIKSNETYYGVVRDYY
ncbi:MAG: SwmB domain-containing protein [Candidatus Wallbacteria bacterium]